MRNKQMSKKGKGDRLVDEFKDVFSNDKPVPIGNFLTLAVGLLLEIKAELNEIIPLVREGIKHEVVLREKADE